MKNEKIQFKIKINDLFYPDCRGNLGCCGGCFFASGVGIAGSTEIGNFVQLGGKVGVAGHIKIADGVQIAGNSGVAKSIDKPMSAWGGSPVMPAIKWHKMSIMLEKMVNNKKEEKNE